MRVVGVIEIVAGIAIAIKPRYAAYIVAAWLGGIVVNLLTYSGYYDIALRDFGVMLAALTLARLAGKFDPPGFSFLHRRQSRCPSVRAGILAPSVPAGQVPARQAYHW